MIISVIFIIFLGLAGGIAVGSGFVAFLTVLGIIPRLTLPPASPRKMIKITLMIMNILCRFFVFVQCHIMVQIKLIFKHLDLQRAPSGGRDV